MESLPGLGSQPQAQATRRIRMNWKIIGTASLVVAVAAAPAVAQTPTRPDTRHKDGNTVTRSNTTTGPNGQTATTQGTVTKDGNTVTHEASATGPQGQTVNNQSTYTKDGSTVTRNGTTTAPSGKTATSNDSWTRSG